MRRAAPPVELPPPFPPPFREMLAQILRHSGRIRGARRETVRSRHRALVQSGTFAGHRPYAQGDDLRRLDWNAYARTGGLYVKLLEEDERRAATVVVDTSGSMLAGDPPRLCTALRLGAILGGLALVHLDGVHVRAGGCDEAFAGRGTVPGLLEHLERAPVRDEPPDAIADALLAQGAPARVHWISDFAAPAAWLRPLQRLRRAGHRVVGWLPAIADDEAVPVGGLVRVLDPETGEELRIAVDAALGAALRRELLLLRRQQEQVFAAGGAALQRLLVPPGFAAGAWLEAGWSFRR